MTSAYTSRDTRGVLGKNLPDKGVGAATVGDLRALLRGVKSDREIWTVDGQQIYLLTDERDPTDGTRYVLITPSS